MKKSILHLFIMMLILSACSGNDDNSSIDTTQLIGTWELDNAKLNGEEVSSSYKIQFTSSERTQFYYLNPTSNTTFGPDVVEDGDYSLSGNTLTITWDESDPGNEISIFQILELTSSKLIIKSVIPGEGTLVEVYTR